MLRRTSGGLNVIKDLPERRARFVVLKRNEAADISGNDRVQHEDATIVSPASGQRIDLRIYRPIDGSGPRPGLVFIHGGGMIMGDLDTDHPFATTLTDRVGCVTVSVDYRLAPENPHPAPVEDCYQALAWTQTHAAQLGIDPSRLGVCGVSSGGGLAAGLALMTREIGTPRLAHQMLIYPMLDDRSDTHSSHEIADLGVWDRSANLEAWQSLLGDRAGGTDVPGCAAAARASDLAGLPPTYIEVGELDLFRDESLDYAIRLLRAGVPTEVHTDPGAYHAFDIVAPRASVSRRAVDRRVAALERALGVPADHRYSAGLPPPEGPA
ncbi:MAG: alpha/beta hydrolase [Geodermatophilaceae bacterium]|nr:alpha/beta hydrolase [Geodermatophilaceae bacterium]